jgi:pyruvate formate lyase activating enzyme
VDASAETPGNDAPTAVIFHVQRFSLHDGPGIRTTLFFKGCPLRCVWCQNPESHRARPEMAFYAAKCVRCFQCAAICPEKAVLTSERRRIDFSRCTHCGRCAETCPGQALVCIGRPWAADALVDELLKDLDYFTDSGGGVTLSGGEPLRWSGFLAELLPRLKARHIHVTLQTCGAFPWELLDRVLPHLDLIYFDLKLMDPEAHRRFTGADNATILDNFSRLAGHGVALQARMPVVPGINDSEDNIVQTAALLLRHGRHDLHCLPYHRLGESKRDAIQALIPPLPRRSPTDAQCRAVQARFQKEGIHAVFYDL